MAIDFASWAMDPRRTREERFGAQILIERAIVLWRNKNKVKVEVNYTALQLRSKDRKLNPAYEPEFSAQDAERVQEVLGEFKEISGWGDDRPVRDISMLQFCPALEKFHLNNTEIRDWSPLQACPELDDVHVMDNVARDFRPLATLKKLEKISMWLWSPWPDLTGFEQLVNLREFNYSGNVLALSSIPQLPALRAAKFDQRFNFHVPFKSLAELPLMPELRRLYLENTWKLDGIERSPLLLNLEVFGYFEDLTPLCALQHLTYLKLGGCDYESLEPLVQLPELRKVVARRDTPQDYSPLAEVPKLHEIELDLCTINKVEVGSINAVLAPWSDEFAVEPARALQPLQLVVSDKIFEKQSSPAALRDWGDDVKMGESEDQWFKRQINRRLNRLLGKGWGHINERYASTPGSEHLTISRGEDIDRLPQVVACLRGLIACAKYPWTFFFCVDSLAEYERDLEEIEEDDGEEKEKEFDAENQRQEWEYSQQRQRERREYLEREYRFRLQQQQGMSVKPQEFAPPPPPKNEDEIPASSETTYDLDTKLNFGGILTETSLVIGEKDVGLVKMLLEIKD